MKQIDQRLFIMKDYLNNHQFDKQKIADCLSVSERHLTRLLKQWEAQKWIIYVRGQGRGNRSEIYFEDYLEQHCVNRVLGQLGSSSNEDIIEVLSMPIAPLYKDIIERSVHDMLIRPTQKRAGEFVRYIKNTPQPDEECFLHNPEHLELIFNISSRLYEMNKEGEIINALVRKDKWKDNSFIMYLKKNIHFYNGHVLFSADVVKCLRESFHSGAMQKYRHMIIDITEISPFKLEIKMKHKNDWIKYILSSIKMTVYKKNNGEILTTGPFYLKNMTQKTVMLVRNDYYYSETGDIGKVLMTSDRQYYFSRIKDRSIKNKYYSNCTDMLTINPYKTDISLEMRQLLLGYTVKFMENHLPESTEFESRMHPLDETYDIESAADKVVFTRPLKFFYHSDDKPSEYLIAFLIQKGVPIIGFELERSSSNNISYYEGDIMFLSEQNSRILGLYNLIESSAFGTWFGHLKQTQEYIAMLQREPMDNWTYIEEKFKNWLYENAYFIYLNSKAQRLTLPVDFQNVVANIYGAIDYNNIVSINSNKVE